MNLWQANMGTPGYGRRVHVVTTNFQFTKDLVDMRGLGFTQNTGIGGRECMACVKY